MAALEKGITDRGTGYAGKSWNILGQVYFPKAVTDSTFAFETNSEPGQFVPVHIHPTQDEFILVQEGVLDLKLDGDWVQAKAGDLVRLPRGIPHGYFNKSDKPARALFWVSPMQKLEALFNQLHNFTDPAEVVRISAQHEVDSSARSQRTVGIIRSGGAMRGALSLQARRRIAGRYRRIRTPGDEFPGRAPWPGHCYSWAGPQFRTCGKIL